MLIRLALASLVTLYATPTNALDLSLIKQLEEKVMVKGDRAEFDGVLVPENNYRWYQGEIEGCSYLRRSELSCVAENGQSFDSLFLTMGLSFGIGLIAGFFIFKEPTH